VKKKIHTCVSVTVIALALLTGCGGGGGGRGSAPVLSATSFSGSEDATISGQIVATDADAEAVTFSKVTDPTKGTVVVQPSGAFVYTPNANANGSDTFSVRATDARGTTTDGTVTVTVSPVNDAPAPVNDVMRKDTLAELGALDVRANDTEPDSEATSVLIEQQPTIGTASVNSDGTIKLDVPSGFKGATQFKYRITDPNSTFGVGTAAVFVGTDPFRVAFAGDEASNGAPEVFMTDFVGASWRVSNATEGNLRLAGFVASNNGSTVVYRRNDSGAGTSELSFVRTANTGNQVRITLPTGFSLVDDSPGVAQYAVSPNGQWIAVLAKSASAGNPISLFVLNVDDPGNLRAATPPAAVFVSTVRMFSDSVYFLASDQAGGATRKSLYRAPLSATPTPVQLSATPSAPGDDVSNYSVSSDQTRIALIAKRGLVGITGLYYVNPAAPGTEVQLNDPNQLGEVRNEAAVTHTIGLAEGFGGSTGLTHVAYTVSIFGTNTVFVADVGPTPNPRSLVTNGTVVGFRPNDTAVLFARLGASLSPEVWEKPLDTGGEIPVGPGITGLYDSAGDTVMLTSPGNPDARVLSSVTRASFGTPQRMGTANQPARFIGLSGAPRAVALLGEGNASSVTLSLVNARAPDRPIPLAGFQSPLNLNSPLAYVVTY
jgi:VCBS repeat-containing protein